METLPAARISTVHLRNSVWVAPTQPEVEVGERRSTDAREDCEVLRAIRHAPRLVLGTTEQHRQTYYQPTNDTCKRVTQPKPKTSQRIFLKQLPVILKTLLMGLVRVIFVLAVTLKLGVTALRRLTVALQKDDKEKKQK